jgi:hypothetical protein
VAIAGWVKADGLSEARPKTNPAPHLQALTDSVAAGRGLHLYILN